MGKIRFGVHEIKGHCTSLPRNCPTEIFAQGGQSDIYRNVGNNLCPKIRKCLNKSWYGILR